MRLPAGVVVWLSHDLRLVGRRARSGWKGICSARSSGALLADNPDGQAAGCRWRSLHSRLRSSTAAADATLVTLARDAAAYDDAVAAHERQLRARDVADAPGVEYPTRTLGAAGVGFGLCGGRG